MNVFAWCPASGMVYRRLADGRWYVLDVVAGLPGDVSPPPGAVAYGPCGGSDGLAGLVAEMLTAAAVVEAAITDQDSDASYSRGRAAGIRQAAAELRDFGVGGDVAKGRAARRLGARHPRGHH